MPRPSRVARSALKQKLEASDVSAGDAETERDPLKPRG
jgi:hypothetical protein